MRVTASEQSVSEIGKHFIGAETSWLGPTTGDYSVVPRYDLQSCVGAFSCDPLPADSKTTKWAFCAAAKSVLKDHPPIEELVGRDGNKGAFTPYRYFPWPGVVKTVSPALVQMEKKPSESHHLPAACT
jgi:hypothetical protein